MGKIRVIQFGLGPIGLEAARLALRKDWIELVGAVDVAPEKVGKDLGELLDVGKLSIPVVRTFQELMIYKPMAVVHCTSSRLDMVAPQIEDVLSRSIPLVSSTEELFFPQTRHRELASRLDEMARKHGVAVLGTGVNPGFVMDALVASLSGVCQQVQRIRVQRIVNASLRRRPLQIKVGAGMEKERFMALAARKEIGHVGLVESLEFLSKRLNLQTDRIEENLNPMIAQAPVKTDYLEVQPGQVSGIHHTAKGYRGSEEILSLDLQMYVGAETSYDSVDIEGTPSVRMKIDGGVAGDPATSAILVNSLPSLLNATPGLRTADEVPLIHFS